MPRKKTTNKPKKEKITKPLAKVKIKPEIIKPAKPTSIPQLLRGMKDILPVDMVYWRWIKKKAEDLADYFCYQFIETPILEMRDLFIRSVGKQTDIIEKEMYTFVDPGGETVCLRPEATASIVRAYINHGMLNLPQPVKFFYFGPMFRHDRPQAGRFRQFHQAGFEIIGDEHPINDAELILIAYSFFQDLNLPVTIQLNSIGCETCRNTYRNELQNYYKTKRGLICNTCKERLARNPLRLLDCKEPGCELVKEGAPQMLNYLCESCHTHFFKVIEYLDDLNFPYVLNPYIVRGLDYYSRTVFEIWPNKSQVKSSEGLKNQTSLATKKNNENGKKSQELEEESGLKSQISLCGGGRYDKLVEILGGRPTGAAGFAIGVERVITHIKECGLTLLTPSLPQVFIAQLGESTRRKALALYNLLQGKVKTAAALSKDGLKAQLEIANRLGVRYTLIIGQKEVLDETIIIRDMEAGIQEIVPYNKVLDDLKRRLSLT